MTHGTNYTPAAADLLAARLHSGGDLLAAPPCTRSPSREVRPMDEPCSAAQTVSGTVDDVAQRQHPSQNISELGALAKFWPAEARKKILTAYIQSNGVGVEAAASLGITYNGLNKIIARLELGDAIDAACEAAGFPRHKGRPRGTFEGAPQVTVRKHKPGAAKKRATRP